MSLEKEERNEIRSEIIENCNKTKVYIEEKMNEMIKLHVNSNKPSLLEIIQKHAFIYTILIFIGIVIGIFFSKIVFNNDMTRAINLQRFEYKGDIFEVQPSQIPKYYDSKKVKTVIEPLKNEVKNK